MTDLPSDVPANMPQELIQMLRGAGGPVTITSSVFIGGAKVSEVVAAQMSREFPDE